MRGLLVALCLLSASFAGCVGLGGNAATIEEANLPEDLVLTYQVQTGQETHEHAFLTQHVAQGGVNLLPYHVAGADFSSPFLKLDETLTPRAYDWSGLFHFPLEAGDSYTATVQSTEVDVTVEETPFEHEGETHDALAVHAASGDGTILEATLLPEPTIIAEIHFDPQDQQPQTWRLLDAEHAPGWNDLPDWTIGDWWRYNATTLGDDAQVTMIYNENRTNNQGSQQRVLNQKEVESRPVALPFQVFLDRNLAPQAGMLNSMISSFWGEWPMQDGDDWTGNSGIAGTYQARLSLDEVTLPGGNTTVAFTMQAHPINDPDGDAFAGWTYAPLVELFTSAWVHAPDEEDPRIDWELTDWGEGYHGEIEIPHLPTVHAREHSDDEPLKEEDTFQVRNESKNLRLSGWFVHGQDATPSMNLTLEAPSGETEWTANETRFQDQVFNLDDVVHDAEPGEWTLHLDIPAEVSFILEVQEVWSQTKTVDYR